MYRSWLIGLGAVVLACVVTQAKAQQIVVDEAGLLNPQEEGAFGLYAPGVCRSHFESIRYSYYSDT